MKREIVLLSTLLLVSVSVPWAQQPSACTPEKIASSIPQKIILGLNRAIKKGDQKEILRIAHQPNSGLRVEARFLYGGHTIGYVIVDRDGCTIVEMGIIKD
jgi:hypothetical protein